MLNWLFKSRDRRIAREAAERATAGFMQRYGHAIKASYDAAADDAEFANWWSNADDYSAKRANSLAVRKKLRKRARYEYANNPFCKGIIDTRANDTIGTGPRLQIESTGISEDESNVIETAWSQWCLVNRIPDKLRTMVKALGYDGEPFGLLSTDQRRPQDVTLTVRLVECDQFTDPEYRESVTPNWCDGINLDANGEPITYRMMRYHPGGDDWIPTSDSYRDIPADDVIHLFRRDRAGQYRGIPDITPALTLFAALRRYRNAVLGAAETAASFAVFFKTMQAGGFDDTVTPFTEMEIQQRLGIYLPAGWEASQMRAEQPTTTYDMFVRVILTEIARCVNMPFSKACGYTADYTYASGKIEERDYEADLAVDRGWIGAEVVDRLFAAWWQEAAAVSVRNGTMRDGWQVVIPQRLWEMDPPQHSWMWDRQEHLDPAKAANAISTRLSCGATTIPIVYAEQGKDAEVEIQKQADFLGMPVGDLKRRLADQLFSDSLSISQQATGATQRAADRASRPSNVADAIEKARVEGYIDDDIAEALLESLV